MTAIFILTALLPVTRHVHVPSDLSQRHATRTLRRFIQPSENQQPGGVTLRRLSSTTVDPRQLVDKLTLWFRDFDKRL